ncbi:MAG: hypothetical protein ACXV7F_04615, partial [Methylomonas sp.]
MNSSFYPFTHGLDLPHFKLDCKPYPKLNVIFFQLCFFYSSLAHALEWSSSDIQYLHGSGYLLGSKDRDIVTIEHSDGWQFGQNYFFVDTTSHDNAQDPVSLEAYGEAYTFFSASKITGLSFVYGPIKDIGITLGFNAGSQPESSPFRAYLAGGSLIIDAP